MKILILTPYPYDEAPSQRFRFEQYLDVLIANGHKPVVKSFLNIETWRILYLPNHKVKKISGLVKGFFHRALVSTTFNRYDVIFIHREASPIGFPIFEWIASRSKAKIVYDFDDAIWLSNTSASNKLAIGLKYHDKIGAICKWSHKISCGNSFLLRYALQYNTNAIINPTTIDFNRHSLVKDHHHGRLVIGWTGSHSTLDYLELVLPAIKQLECKYEFDFVIIADQNPHLSLSSFVYKPWNKSSEIEDLLSFSIGIMPMPNSTWTQGKCGFKALQYMALGIPAVVSPIGVNCEIIEDKVDGFFCSKTTEWVAHLTALLQDTNLRTDLGRRGRDKVKKHYSLEANKANFLSLFE